MTRESLVEPTRVAIDAAGNLWIVDAGARRVLGMDHRGAVHTVLAGDHPDPDASPGELRAVSITADGQVLYIVHATALQRISLPGGERAVVPLAGPDGAAPDDLRAVALDPDAPHTAGAGVLYLAAADAVIRFDLSAHRGQILARASQPTGLALSPDRRRLYVIESRPPAIKVVDLRSGAVAALGAAFGDLDPADRHGPDLTVTPFGIAAVVPRQDLLCGINLRHGTVVPIWQKTGSDALRSPSGVAFDRQSRTYVVADTGNRRILRIARDAAGATTIA